jgi:hypothetical protein
MTEIPPRQLVSVALEDVVDRVVDELGQPLANAGRADRRENRCDQDDQPQVLRGGLARLAAEALAHLVKRLVQQRGQMCAGAVRGVMRPRSVSVRMSGLSETQRCTGYAFAR